MLHGQKYVFADKTVTEKINSMVLHHWKTGGVMAVLERKFSLSSPLYH